MVIPTGRIPSLDGLRAISIVSVTLSHWIVDPSCPIDWPWARLLGGPGVNLFFVISGFLITHLLLREYEKTAGVSLRGFYLRRSLRILPAYVVFLSMIWWLCQIGMAQLDGRAWFLALTYTVNMVPKPPAWIEHVWSLSVEEHFYLMWPVAVALLGPRRSVAALLAVVLAAPLLRYMIWTRTHNTYVNISFFTPTRIDTIAIGCLLAFYVRTDAAARVAERIKPRADAVLVGLAALLWAAFSVRSGEYDLLLLRAIEAALMSAIVFVSVISPNSAIGRVLNCRPFVAVGVLSYSLYLWQPLTYPATDRWPLGPWQNLVLLAVVAVASYLLVERPFLRLKDRLA